MAYTALMGAEVKRREDPRLVRGAGAYVGDMKLPGMLHMVLVRSPYAHALIRAIDPTAARAMPGVLAVWTAADLDPHGYGEIRSSPVGRNRDGTPMREVARPALARDRLRYVGDPVAIVIAETRDQARDAAEAVELDVETLPAVTSARDALAPGAPVLYDHVPGNLQYDFSFGDAGRVSAAFAAAAHVTRLDLVINRTVVCAMEPRAAAVAYDAQAQRWTVHIGSQGVFGMRAALADAMKAPAEAVRVLTGNVGGSFGMKAGLYPEYICLLHAARALGLGHEIGTLEPGAAADVCVWRWAGTPLAQRRQDVARDLHDRLFAWITSGDERDLVETRVAGRRAHAAGYASA